VGVKEVRTACRFADHVNKIIQTVPGSLGRILDDGHSHLTPKTVADIARRTSRGIKQAMSQASAGLHPFAATLPADLPEEYGPWHHDLTMLRDAKDLLDRVLMHSGRLNSATVSSLAVHLTAICALLDSLRPILRGQRRKPSTCPTREKSHTDVDLVRWVDRARQRIESVIGNLPRAARTREPSASVRSSLSQAVQGILSVAETLRSRFPASIRPVRPPAVEGRREVPLKQKGTYVVLYRVKQDGIVIFGRSDSFLVRAGYVLYVGSAFQAGGVQSRTLRHFEGTGPRLWGIDDLRGFAIPIGLWWTHHSDKVECIWARALARIIRCRHRHRSVEEYKPMIHHGLCRTTGAEH